MGEVKSFTKEEFEQFIEDIDKLQLKKMSVEKTRVMFEVLCSGAMRINEVLHLTPDDILKDGTIRIKEAKGGWAKCNCSEWHYRPTKLISSDKDCTRCHGKGKVRVPQYTFLSEHILIRLRQIIKDIPSNQRIFPISDRQALNYVNQLADAGTHAFRHSWLTWLVESKSVDLARVRDMARHTSLAVTDRYIQRNEALTRKEVNNASKDFIQ